MTLDRQSDLATDLADALTLMHARARDLVLDVANAGGHGFTSDLMHARARHAGPRDIASALAHADSRDIAGALVGARNIVGNLVHAMNTARDLATDLDLARDIAAELTLAAARADDLALYLGRGGADLARDLATNLLRARDLATNLLRAQDQAVEPGGEDRGVPSDARSRERARTRRVAPSACRLVAVAAWLLPAGERVRYGEEYRSELHDLVGAGAGRRKQLGHAVRLVVRSVPLRLAVLAPRREKASP